MHILEKLRRRLFGELVPPEPDAFLDVVLEEIAETTSLAQRRALWAEVARRFNHDVERACQIARAAHPKQKAGEILDEALRSIGSEPPQYFSRELVRIMKKHLGEEPVGKVTRSVYLRQFLTELPTELVPYAAGLLDQQGHTEWLADRRSEKEEEVRKRCTEALERLPGAVEQEYNDEELAERTDGVWTIHQLRETDWT